VIAASDKMREQLANSNKQDRKGPKKRWDLMAVAGALE